MRQIAAILVLGCMSGCSGAILDPPLPNMSEESKKIMEEIGLLEVMKVDTLFLSNICKTDSLSTEH